MELTQKQETFCLAYIETGNSSEAYRQAYDAENMKPETINREAKTLMDNPKIATSIEAIQAEQRKRHNITTDSITADAKRVFDEAIEAGQLSAANSALTLISKLHGLLTDKVENKVSVEMTPEQAGEVLRECGIDPEALTHG